MAYNPSVDKVLGKINDVTPLDEEEFDGSNEWFLIESDDLSGDDLFYTLRGKWFRIVGQYYGQFALIYCVQQPDAGFWVHSFSASDKPSAYAPGCFKVYSW